VKARFTPFRSTGDRPPAPGHLRAMNRIRLSMHREYIRVARCRRIINSRPSWIRSSEEETRSNLPGGAYKRFLRRGTCCRAKRFSLEDVYTSRHFVRFALNSRSAFFDEVGRRIFPAEYLILPFCVTPEFSTLNSVFILFHY